MLRPVPGSELGSTWVRKDNWFDWCNYGLHDIVSSIASWNSGGPGHRSWLLMPCRHIFRWRDISDCKHKNGADLMTRPPSFYGRYKYGVNQMSAPGSICPFAGQCQPDPTCNSTTSIGCVYDPNNGRPLCISSIEGTFEGIKGFSVEYGNVTCANI